VSEAEPNPANCLQNNEIHMSAGNESWKGILYAPCGDIEFGQGETDLESASNISCTQCLIQGRYVEIKGDNFHMNDAAGPQVPSGPPKLVK